MRDADEWKLRVELAAAFRLAADFGWHESVANHFSAAVSGDGKQFLLNPRWKHFATMRASELLRLNADDDSTMQREDAPDPSAWCIHGNLHKRVAHARILLHCHPPYTTALAALADPTLYPICQNTARFFNRVAVDTGFDGIADNDAEGQRLAASFGNRHVMMMGNHGITVAAPTVAVAFDQLYFFERAAKTLMLAYSSGRPLAILSDEVAEKTAAGWDDYQGMAIAHFEQLKAMLLAKDASFAS